MWERNLTHIQYEPWQNDSRPSSSRLSFPAQNAALKNHNTSPSECLCQHCLCFSPSSADVCACLEKKWAVLKHFTDGFWVVVSMELQTHHMCVWRVCQCLDRATRREGTQSPLVRGDDTDSYERCLFAPPVPTPSPLYSQAGPGVRSVLSPVFPMGNIWC